MKNVPESINSNKIITKGLGLASQKQRRKSGEENTYPDPPVGIERIEIIVDTGKNERRILGHCKFKYFVYPFPFYFMSWVIPRNVLLMGNTKTTALVMRNVNLFLEEKKKPAFLYNDIPETHIAHNLYERNGWIPIQDYPKWMSFNLPENIKKSDIEIAISSTIQQYIM
jgi:hypothetical protein